MKDGSDEICEVSEKCPKQTFQCKNRLTKKDRNVTRNSIKCISRSKRCDGFADCEQLLF